MTAKEYLEQIPKLNRRLTVMTEQLKFLRSAAEYVSPHLTGLPRSNTPDVHIFENNIIHILELEEALNAEFAKLSSITNMVNTIPDSIEQLLLIKRYVNGKQWREISTELHISPSHLYRLHNKALENVEKMIANGSN